MFSFDATLPKRYTFVASAACGLENVFGCSCCIHFAKYRARASCERKTRISTEQPVACLLEFEIAMGETFGYVVMPFLTGQFCSYNVTLLCTSTYMQNQQRKFAFILVHNTMNVPATLNFQSSRFYYILSVQYVLTNKCVVVARNLNCRYMWIVMQMPEGCFDILLLARNILCYIGQL